MVLGDRYEIFSVAIAASMHNIPLIHIHGGEKTLANYDEFIRHSITKMSKLHLTSTEEYKKRVIQLGESLVVCLILVLLVQKMLFHCIYQISRSWN